MQTTSTPVFVPRFPVDPTLTREQRAAFVKMVEALAEKRG